MSTNTSSIWKSKKQLKSKWLPTLDYQNCQNLEDRSLDRCLNRWRWWSWWYWCGKDLRSVRGRRFKFSKHQKSPFRDTFSSLSLLNEVESGKLWWYINTLLNIKIILMNMTVMLTSTISKIWEMNFFCRLSFNQVLPGESKIFKPRTLMST